MSINVAIIGSGIFAKEEHLPAIEASPHLKLVAIYSRSLKSASSLAEAAAEGSSLALYADDAGSGKTYHDLLLRDDIHAVTIALPIMSQPEYIEAALLAGKHVLSEKPIAPTIQHAQKLLNFYNTKIDTSKVFWSVAENYRFLDSFRHAASEIARLGPVTGFRVKVFTNVEQGGKYYETSWRKTPAYQGGFLLDGGVHFVAATRQLLGTAQPLARVAAFSQLNRPHLPPIDTVNAILQTAPGVSGTFAVSFGSTLSGPEYTVSCERGSVSVVMSTVTVREGEEKAGVASVREFQDEGSGVKQEVAAWAQAIARGGVNARQSAREALADLEVLEKLIVSGSQGGAVQGLEFS